MLPSIRTWSGVRSPTAIRRVDLDAHGLTDEIDRQHEPRVRALSHETSDDTFERAGFDLHHHALLDERARVECEFALDELTNAINLHWRDGRWVTVGSDNRHHPFAFENRQPIVGVESRETVAGKQRPFDLFLAVLPAAPLIDGGQKHLDVLLLELIAD